MGTRMEYWHIGEKSLDIIWCIIVLFFSVTAVQASELASKPTFPGTITVRYFCKDGKQLDVSYDNIRRRAALEWEGRTVVLPQAVSASGTRYTVDGETVFWSKGKSASFWKNGVLICEGGE